MKLINKIIRGISVEFASTPTFNLGLLLNYRMLRIALGWSAVGISWWPHPDCDCDECLAELKDAHTVRHDITPDGEATLCGILPSDDMTTIIGCDCGHFNCRTPVNCPECIKVKES